LVDVGVPAIGRNRPLALEVTDARDSPVFGSRGGLYGETALLTPRTEVAQSLRQALGERLAAAGFRIVTADTPDSVSLDVRIQQLDYRLDTPAGPGGGVVNDARAEAVLDAILTNAGRSHGARYQASSVRRVVGYPSEADNAALLNEVVAQSLRQLLQDPQLLALLAE
jgi:uncharacterized lipoprotein